MHTALNPDRLYVAVDALILTVRSGRLHILLSRRVNPPYAGQWALPGRLVGQDESAETAVRLLLEEMFPVRDAYKEQLYTFSDVSRDPRGRVISAAYLVLLPRERAEERMKEETSCCFFAVYPEGNGLRLEDGGGTVLTDGDLAFDHARMIRTGIHRLRGKVDYTDIAFRFLDHPEAFSLSDLQAVFEAILGQNLDSSNFRRGILARYEKTGRLRLTEQAEKRGRGRPAALYRITF